MTTAATLPGLEITTDVLIHAITDKARWSADFTNDQVATFLAMTNANHADPIHILTRRFLAWLRKERKNDAKVARAFKFRKA